MRGGLHAQVSVTSSANESSFGGESIALVVRDGLEVRLPMAGEALESGHHCTLALWDTMDGVVREMAGCTHSRDQHGAKSLALR